MNSTFMFGEDRFIRTAYVYLDARYPNEKYRHSFPSVESAIREVADANLDRDEIERIVDTFAFHELGYIPNDYAAAFHKLRQRFTLAAVIDIWSPKTAWLNTFERAGISRLFSATSFSSDHGMVKPSPKPLELVLSQLRMDKSEAIVVGDSLRRDLGGAKSADIDCILLGGAEHPHELRSFSNLLELYDIGSRALAE